MHFLGLAGMPRRIGDYPDTYGPWNYIITIGSLISFVSIILFLYIIYNQLTNKVPFNSWNKLLNYFDKDSLNYLNINKRFNNSLESLLSNPPAFHAFTVLPQV